MLQLVSWSVMLFTLASCQSPQGTYVSAEEYSGGGAQAAEGTRLPAPARVESQAGGGGPVAAGPAGEDEIVGKRREFEGRRRGLHRQAEDLDRKRADLEDKRRKSSLENQSAQAQADVDLAAAERALRLAEQDLEHFVEVERDRRLREDQLTLTSSSDNLTEVAEELAQLEMMYDDSDLGDATAEIVLQRTRRRIRRAEERHALVEAKSRDLRSITLPREEESLRAKRHEAVVKLDNLRRGLEAAALSQAMAQRGLEGEQVDLARKAEDLARDETELEQDMRSWESGLSARGS